MKKNKKIVSKDSEVVVAKEVTPVTPITSVTPEVVSKVIAPVISSEPLIPKGTPITDVPVYSHAEIPFRNAPPRVQFKALGGRIFYFAQMKDNQTIMAWEERKAYAGEHEEVLGLLRTNQVDTNTLKEIGVWDILSPEEQKKLEEGVHEETQGVKDLMEKARAARRSRYDNVPRELECIQCHSKKPIAPGTLVTRVEKIRDDKGLSTYSVEDYVKVYKCRKCNPFKGKQCDPELLKKYEHLPKELVCSKCSGKVNVVPSVLLKRIEKLGVTIEKYVAEFKCQTCFSTKGRKRNPELANVPKELVCNKCKMAKPCPPSGIAQRAKLKGKTIEEFLKSYFCQVCVPTKGRKKGQKVKKAKKKS